MVAAETNGSKRRYRGAAHPAALAKASGIASNTPGGRSMDVALTIITVFAVFIPALVLPGPDFVAVVRPSMTSGTRAGLLATLGVTAGPCFYATLGLLGLRRFWWSSSG